MVYKIFPESLKHYNKIKKQAVMQGYKWTVKSKGKVPFAVILFPLNRTVSLLKKCCYKHFGKTREFYPKAIVINNLKIRDHKKSRGRKIKVIETGVVHKDINALMMWLIDECDKDVIFPNKLYTAIKQSRKMYGYRYTYIN